MLLLRIAFRFLFAARGRLFARGLTGLAIVSVALGVFAMTAVLGAMQGFRVHLEAKLRGFSPAIHITPAIGADLAHALAPLREREGVTLYRVIEGDAIAQPIGREGFADLGVRVRGIQPAMLDTMESADFFFATELSDAAGATLGAQALAIESASSQPGLIVGSEVLYALGAHPEGERRVRLTAPLADVDPTGSLRPRQYAFDITGFFRSGLFQHDSKLVLMQYAVAEKLLGAQGTPRWFVYATDDAAVEPLAQRLQQTLGANASVETWATQNQKLFGALKLERMVMTVLLLLTVGIASLSILGVVFLQTSLRRRDLAVIHALGLSRRRLVGLVLAMGGWIGVVGACLGGGSALGLSAWVARHPIRLPETFYIDFLPIDIGVVSSVGFALLGVMLAVIAAAYPAWWMLRIAPVEGLRYE